MNETDDPGAAGPNRGPATSLSTIPAVATLLLLAALGGSTLLAYAPAPQSTTVRRDTIPVGDLRCLTARAGECLDRPVPEDEPHGAVCSTCHDLGRDGVPSRATQSCARGRCHSDPTRAIPFHGTVSPDLLADCVACHDPHDARMDGGAMSCGGCHAGAGVPASMAGEVGRHRPLAPSSAATFRHADHGNVECTACHASGIGHRVVRVTTLADCRGCHHALRTSDSCVACHVHEGLKAPVEPVEWTFDIRIGALDRPVRPVDFQHDRHDAVPCVRCHDGESTIHSASTQGCASCHDEHHAPSADCTACHEPPSPGAHTVRAHLGCTGPGCHEAAPAPIRDAPRTRSLCLSCHRDLDSHEEGGDCATCHLLPAPRQHGDQAPRRMARPTRSPL